MKYFANIHNAEELRKAYRALCLTLHPDHGGNEEEFKAMLSEFETLKKQYQNGTAGRAAYTRTESAEERARREAEEAREREAWARWEAEERARREAEEREKAERIRKAQEESRAAVRAWAGILERVAADATGQKARFYRFDDKKQAAAFLATTKRNIKAVITHYYPGLKVSVNISGEIWKEKFVISWEDGPNEKQLRKTCKELAYFIPAFYESDPFADYGDYKEDHSTAPWREAYGQALGDITDFQTVRTLSAEGKQEAEALAARYFANFDPKSDAPKFAANLQEFANLAKAAGFDDIYNLTDTFRSLTGLYYNDMCGTWDEITGEVSRRRLAEILAEYVAVTVTEKEKADRRAAEFRPRYGEALRKLRELTGVGNTDKDGDAVCFFCADGKARRRLTIAEAVARLEQGEAVSFGTEHTGADGDKWYWGKFAGGYKTQDKRAEKFAAAGLIIRGHISPNSFISLHGIAPDFAAAIRADLADVERQRKAWEEGKQAEPKAAKAAADKQQAAQSDEAPAEGLQLIDTADGVAVIGNDWKDTYYNKKAIRAHGATWNKERKQWEATDPADVASLRAWFALRDGEQAAAEPAAEQEPAAEPEPAADNTASASESEAGTLEDGGRISPLLEAVADLLATLAGIFEQAKKCEGVTVPAATLERWKQEAEAGTKTAAARFAEVCACLASLTPDSRKQFDGLGVIFWTLSEQLRNGYNPDTIRPATEYARAQLFDLINSTQNENQARAIRDALNEAA